MTAAIKQLMGQKSVQKPGFLVWEKSGKTADGVQSFIEKIAIPPTGSLRGLPAPTRVGYKSDPPFLVASRGGIFPRLGADWHL
ncbi:hypothetical protein [Kamptonema formosum]|uniref:hypothetical protein n=1 Tax=Kamptonema formosum TaxID=331992 RepID=UPI00035EDD9D|nr:hypothetical protein [Oscillatoria sp. PCC 10802]